MESPPQTPPTKTACAAVHVFDWFGFFLSLWRDFSRGNPRLFV